MYNYYNNPIEDRLVVFDHGFFGGHRSYMREIETLCKHGYRVFAYDHTGCMESEGETPNGMSQSLRDLNDCISVLRAEERYKDIDISVVGHSWGGFSTLNISALHPDISHVVVMSGFVSVELLVNSIFGGLLSGYRKAIMDLECASNPDFVNYNAVESLRSTKAKVLLIYSKNDGMCKKAPHYDTLHKELSAIDNISFILVPNKGHNPNYTEDAVKYLNKYVSKRTALLKKGRLSTPEQKAEFVSSFDWKRMTEQDNAVWEKIFNCLDN